MLLLAEKNSRPGLYRWQLVETKSRRKAGCGEHTRNLLPVEVLGGIDTAARCFRHPPYLMCVSLQTVVTHMPKRRAVVCEKELRSAWCSSNLCAQDLGAETRELREWFCSGAKQLDRSVVQEGAEPQCRPRQ